MNANCTTEKVWLRSDPRRIEGECPACLEWEESTLTDATCSHCGEGLPETEFMRVRLRPSCRALDA